MAGMLSGIHVLVTRPEKQAAHLASCLRQAGAIPVLFPVLQISEAGDPGALRSLIARLGEFDYAIFVSPNAVEMAMRLVAPGEWPGKVRCAVVGKSSARMLEKYGVDDALCPPTRFDSEGLLELPEFSSVDGARIVIFRGNGGREHLGDALTRRGALVEYVECYSREKPACDAAALRAAHDRGELDAVTATSCESVENLREMAGDWICEVPLFVPHPRIAEAAGKLGFGAVCVTAAGDEGLVGGLIDWFGKEKHGNG